MKIEFKVNEIAKRLKEIRESKNYTKKYVCENLDIDIRRLIDIEFGIKLPSIYLLIDLCNIYETNIDEILSYKVI